MMFYTSSCAQQVSCGGITAAKCKTRRFRFISLIYASIKSIHHVRTGSIYFILFVNILHLFLVYSGINCENKLYTNFGSHPIGSTSSKQLNNYLGSGRNEKLPPRRIPSVGIVRKVPSTPHTKLTHKHHHHGGAVCPSYRVHTLGLI